MQDERREIEFVGTLGVGGFGAVYLANLHGRDRFVRRVAVKVMKAGLDETPDLVARQKDEARLLGLLAHDGIVQVLDLTEIDGRPAVVMEYVEGADLSEVLKALHPGRLPVRAGLEIIAAVASALDAAYNTPSALTGQPLRVIHRDIKPANVLLTANGRVKVLDFGVAKADFAREGQTMTNGGWGTPRFMAPEQWLGEPLGAPIDVYALGVTLYDLVANRTWERPPLTRATYEHRVAAQLDTQTHLGEELLALVAIMTAYEPGDRPTPAELGEHLEGMLRDAPGEGLLRFAREFVPPLVEAKMQAFADQPLPPNANLAGLSGSRSVPVRVDAQEPSITSRTPTSPIRPALAGLLLLAIGAAAVSAVGLSVLAWRLREGGSPTETANVGPPSADQPPSPAEELASDADRSPPVSPAADAAPADGAAEVVADSPAATPAPSTRARRAASADHGAAPPPASPVATATTTVAPTAIAATTAAPAEAKTPAAAAAWPVEITSVPIGADVWVDGRRAGKTPLTTLRLPEGAHTFFLVLGEQRSAPTTIAVGPDTTARSRYYFSDEKWRSVK